MVVLEEVPISLDLITLTDSGSPKLEYGMNIILSSAYKFTLIKEELPK